jgi:hypothetical protein
MIEFVNQKMHLVFVIQIEKLIEVNTSICVSRYSTKILLLTIMKITVIELNEISL